MKLIVISHRDFLPEEIDLLKALFEAGLIRFHLRKPNATKDEIRQFLQTFNEDELSKIVVHGFQELAEEFPIGGIHFREAVRKKRIKDNQKFRPLYPKLKEGDSFTVSTSVHDFRSFSDLSDEFDYAFISPVFDSISKKGYGKNPELQSGVVDSGYFFSGRPKAPRKNSGMTQDFVFKTEQFRKDVKLIALGGVDASRIASIKKWGYDGAAVLGAIWSNPEKAISTFLEIKAAVEKEIFINR